MKFSDREIHKYLATAEYRSKKRLESVDASATIPIQGIPFRFDGQYDSAMASLLQKSSTYQLDSRDTDFIFQQALSAGSVEQYKACLNAREPVSLFVDGDYSSNFMAGTFIWKGPLPSSATVIVTVINGQPKRVGATEIAVGDGIRAIQFATTAGSNPSFDIVGRDPFKKTVIRAELRSDDNAISAQPVHVPPIPDVELYREPYHLAPVKLVDGYGSSGRKLEQCIALASDFGVLVPNSAYWDGFRTNHATRGINAIMAGATPYRACGYLWANGGGNFGTVRVNGAFSAEVIRVRKVPQ